MRRVTDFVSVQDMARAAFRDGAIPNGNSVRWDLSSTCEDPVSIEHAGTGYVKDGGALNKRHSRIYVDTTVRCRKCRACLRSRAWLWRTRAEAEIKVCPRTWLGTFTLSPENHMRFEYVARLRWKGYEAATAEEQFAARHVAISPEFTKYLKRVRKQSGADLRYLLVAERHKSGLPHYHMLVHEVDEWKPVRHAVLRDQWSLGFTHFKLVKGPEAASYAAKYLSKDASARVRASIDYGNSLRVVKRDTPHDPPPPPNNLSF